MLLCKVCNDGLQGLLPHKIYMAEFFNGNKVSSQGYVYTSYGSEVYLKFAVASVQTLRRYDRQRPSAIFCSPEHARMIEKNDLSGHFDYVFLLPDENQSITGFKHHMHSFLPFHQNMILDSDIVWCKDPDPLWSDFQSYDFTITGNQSADIFFGSFKGWKIIRDFIFRTRKKTLKRFGVTYLSRVQSGMIYTSDENLTKEVCTLAQELLSQRDLTHFRSRIEEKGRHHETCEWSLALAMAKLKLQVYPWLLGYRSPQLDFIESYTMYDQNFENVTCLLYSDRFIYDLKAIQQPVLRKLLIKFFSVIPGKSDHLYVKPYCLHFGWHNEKNVLRKFSDRVWTDLARAKEKDPV